MFFPLFYMSARITLRPSIAKKTCVFLTTTRASDIYQFSKKKKIQDIKKKFPGYVFVFLVFFITHLNFFKNRLSFPEIDANCFVANINFAEN